MGAGYLLPFEGAGKGGEGKLASRIEIPPKQRPQCRPFRGKYLFHPPQERKIPVGGGARGSGFTQSRNSISMDLSPAQT